MADPGFPVAGSQPHWGGGTMSDAGAFDENVWENERIGSPLGAGGGRALPRSATALN